MRVTNFDQEMQKEISLIPSSQRPRLLLHSCCAVCSSYCLQTLGEHFDIDIYFYNPNIDTLEEFEKRLQEQKKLLELMPLPTPKPKLIVVPYNQQEFLSQVKGQENAPEGGSRCQVCFQLRLLGTAEYASKHHYDYFTTTLTISPHKNAPLINNIGQNLNKQFDSKFLPSDFKKRQGYQNSIALSKKYSLYRQNYCGCIFSHTNH